MSFAPSALDGVLVTDLSRVMAGPFATQMLGDMGAVVLKIEAPGGGDDSRNFAPPWWGGESAYFLSANRNKRSVALDLKSPEGVDIVKRLARKSDVVIENFRPGTAERMGLGYEALSADNPRLVYVTISGFGITGPDSQRPGYDVLAQSMGGIMSLTGVPDGAPAKMGVPQADLITGLYAVIGTLLALVSRERTGKGQHVDTSLLEGQVSLLTFAAMGHFATEKPPRRMGNRHSSIAPYQTYEASDGYFTVAVGNDRMWPKFCEIIERAELEKDPRFATNPDRVDHIDALDEVLRPIFMTRRAEEWVQRFDAGGIPAGPLLTVPQVLEHPQVLARDMVVEMEHPTIGAMKAVGNPIKMSATPARYDAAPPLLGQHTEEVLQVFLDYTPEQVSDLRTRGVIVQWRPQEAAVT
ncbi:MAG: CoA transferase [Armatimonadetes bacterium]|nr:CoA transferase [Armatimonadota bacterium]